MEITDSMIKGIIFDLDGTLIRLPIDYDRLRNRLKNLLGIKELSSPLLPTLLKLTMGKLSMLKEAFEIIDDEELRAVEKLVWMRGSKKLIKRLKKDGYRTALVTLQGKKGASLILEKRGLFNYFDEVVSRDECMDREGQICLAIKSLELDKSEVVVIGDRLNDVDSAKRVGCKAILIKKGINRYDGAEKVILTLTQLDDIL